jgi:hypothetical protein
VLSIEKLSELGIACCHAFLFGWVLDTIRQTALNYVRKDGEGKMNRRLMISILTGAILGILCIIGGSLRAGGFAGNELFLGALWYNRVIMGLVIGLAGEWRWGRGPLNAMLRGLVLGFLISLAFYLSSGGQDSIALFAGAVYGVILELVLQRHAASTANV